MSVSLTHFSASTANLSLLDIALPCGKTRCYGYVSFPQLEDLLYETRVYIEIDEQTGKCGLQR